MNTLHENASNTPLAKDSSEYSIRKHLVRVCLGMTILFFSPDIFRTVYQHTKGSHTLTADDLRAHSLAPSGIFTRDGLTGIAHYKGQYANEATEVLMKRLHDESEYRQKLLYLTALRSRMYTEEKEKIVQFLKEQFLDSHTDAAVRYLIAQILVAHECNFAELVAYFQTGVESDLYCDPKYTLPSMYSIHRNQNLIHEKIDRIILRAYGRHLDSDYTEKSLHNECLYCLQLLTEFHPDDVELQRIYTEAKRTAQEAAQY